MFIVAVCAQKNNHSSNPFFNHFEETIGVCRAGMHSELGISAWCTMESLNADASSWGTGWLCVPVRLSLSVRGARQR